MNLNCINMITVADIWKICSVCEPGGENGALGTQKDTAWDPDSRDRRWPIFLGPRSKMPG